MQGKRKRETGDRSLKSEAPLPERLTEHSRQSRETVEGCMYEQRARALKLGAILFFVFAMAVSAQEKSETVVTIGNEKIGIEEFEANYRKNNTNVLDRKDLKTPAEYLDLYIKFKLKVIEAEKLGYDTVRSYRDELAGYRKELAKPYLTDVSFNEEMVKTQYYRTINERKASHLLIRLAPEALPADTLAAWNKINSLRNQIIAGADFNEMAVKYSEDPSAAQNKGLLGYFTAFQMLYPFEDMTYKTPIGQISQIVRTRFGYHIIKVHDERPAAGEIKVAHIMKMFPQQASEEDIAKLKLSADSLWQKATTGADFGELAKKYSDDKQSSADGGVMNWFTPNNMVPSFAEAAFALKNDGDISPVIRTPYGWHIIKRLERKTAQPFEKMRSDLETKIKQNPQISKHSDEAFYRKLRIEYNLKINEPNLIKFITWASDTTSWKKQTPNDPIQKLDLVTFAKQKFNTGTFTDFLHKLNFAPQTRQTEAQFRDFLNKFINQKLLAYENTQLELKYPDFARIYKEYHDGILLFNISKDKIWDVATSDTARLQNYFDHSEKKYYWNERFKGWIIKANDLETRSKVETMLNEREAGKQELADIFNTPAEQKIQITDVACEKGENQVVDYFIWSGTKPSGFDETTTFVHGKLVKNEQKSLKDAWGLYSTDFQEQIEKEWVESLQKKYPVAINPKVLKKIQSVE